MPFIFDYPDYVFSEDMIAHGATCAVEEATVRSDGTMDAVLRIYAVDTTEAFAQRQFFGVPYDKTVPDVMAQAEAYLLTLDEFAGAAPAAA